MFGSGPGRTAAGPQRPAARLVHRAVTTTHPKIIIDDPYSPRSRMSVELSGPSRRALTAVVATASLAFIAQSVLADSAAAITVA